MNKFAQEKFQDKIVRTFGICRSIWLFNVAFQSFGINKTIVYYTKNEALSNQIQTLIVI